MDSKKIINSLLFIVKLVFLVGSWLTYFLYKSGKIEYAANVKWRDINEYSLYFFILLLVIELIYYKSIKKTAFTFLCICTAFLFEQHDTAEGTRLDSWF